MKHSYILWDFNGTIYDDAEAALTSANLLLCRRGMRELPDIESYRELFRFPIKEYYRRLGFDFEKEPFEKLAVEWVPYYLEASRPSRLVDGVYEAITSFGALGYRQTVVSASETAMLNEQLRRLGLGGVFDGVSGSGDIYAHGKEDVALRWRREHPGEGAVFVGDTVHDFEVASAIGADCLLYSGGHETRRRLDECGCPVFDDMRELTGIILGL